MQRLWLTIMLITLLGHCSRANEHLVLSGGPALRQWEQYRIEPDQHDRWWANFIRAATLHIDLIRAEEKAQGLPKSRINWYVYKLGYSLRGREDGKPYTRWIQEQANKRGARLIWINTGDEFINHLNRLPAGRTRSFHYFGHSNKHCFLLDYSSQILGVSAAWIHETDLRKLSGRAFSKGAICKSWGCYTGESMNRYWKRATGVAMISARGKTDYSTLAKSQLPSTNKGWVK
ncbi:hypothetical protein [Rubritalea marina]|uniref:hypothetical protein n=1 Tax=Rubritalea marina TaxID=361055 RepID=UPI00036BF1EF|nr:hypothetical protein [Rubritalea marina]